MNNSAKNALLAGAYALGIFGTVTGAGCLLDSNNKLSFQEIKHSSIVITDDKEGLHYHLAQQRYDGSFDNKYIDILNNRVIPSLSIIQIDEAVPYFTELYNKKSVYYKDDLKDIIDDLCKKHEYATAHEKVNVKVR